MSRTLVDCSPALEALAEASGDHNPHRADELYRCALIGVYARLAGTLTVLTGGEAMRHAVAPGVALRPSRRTARRSRHRARVPDRPSRRRFGRAAGWRG